MAHEPQSPIQEDYINNFDEDLYSWAHLYEPPVELMNSPSTFPSPTTGRLGECGHSSPHVGTPNNRGTQRSVTPAERNLACVRDRTQSHNQHTRLVKKPFKPKLDPNAYPKLTNNGHYQSFEEQFYSTIRSQGLGHLIDEDYVPPTQEDALDFHKQNAWVYRVLQENIQTSTGGLIVRESYDDFYLLHIMAKLRKDAQQSPDGMFHNQEALAWITSAQYDSSKGSATKFIAKFLRVTRLYNKSVQDSVAFTKPQLKTFLHYAVMHIHSLNVVSIREKEKMVVGLLEKPYTFDQYLAVLKAAATAYDTTRMCSIKPHLADPDPYIRDF